MSVHAYSKFYYGFIVDENNRYINFDEGGDELTAVLPIGAFTLTKILEVASQAMNDVGALDYIFSVNRTTRIVTLDASANFNLLGSTGTNAGQSALPTLGIPAADHLADDQVIGSSAAGYSYSPQFPLQDFVPSANGKKALSATVTTSASGNKVSVQSFGEERYMKCNIKWVNNSEQGSGGKLRSSPTAVEDLISFLEYCVTKAPIEFMQNESNLDAFERLILWSTPSNGDGTGFELKEYYDKDLPDWFESGALSFKVIQE